VRLAMTEVDRVSHIVAHTLQFNRGGDARSWERASHIIESAIGLFESRLRQSGVLLHRDYAANDRLFCLPKELRQVFANLIGNALDALQFGGKLILRSRVQVHTKSGESRVRITVADSGGGMAPDTLAKLFQPFLTTKGDHGTGLGLWVSREILDRHGATVKVRSCQTSGRSGTVFSISIPTLSERG